MCAIICQFFCVPFSGLQASNRWMHAQFDRPRRQLQHVALVHVPLALVLEVSDLLRHVHRCFRAALRLLWVQHQLVALFLDGKALSPRAGSFGHIHVTFDRTDNGSANICARKFVFFRSKIIDFVESLGKVPAKSLPSPGWDGTRLDPLEAASQVT